MVADSILRHEFEAMNGIREDTWLQMQAIMDDTRRKLDSVLSPANASDITRCWRSRNALSVRATPGVPPLREILVNSCNDMDRPSGGG